MNVFTIAGIVGILVIIVGVVVAALFVWLSRTVKENQVEMRAGQSATIESATLGYELPTGADVPAQLAEARKLAARRAAAGRQPAHPAGPARRVRRHHAQRRHPRRCTRAGPLALDRPRRAAGRVRRLQRPALCGNESRNSRNVVIA